ncbi:sugar-binding transcriptional regulator [Eremococcus coleocola]|nr:sugar-binding domain-containing protein [Eremococcus coleocola]
MDVYSIIQSLVPELDQLLPARLELMRYLSVMDNRVGRQSLAQALNLSERTMRSLINVLRGQNIVDVERNGVQLTDFGQKTLAQIEKVLETDTSLSLSYYETALKQHFNLKDCIVLPGDSLRQESVYEAMSHAVQDLLAQLLHEGDNVIAVTGGYTLAHVGRYFLPHYRKGRKITFVPTRGGFGGDFSIQSSTVGGLMARQSQADYIPFFIPESLTAETSRLLMEEPSVKEAIEISKKADCLLLSVGTADVMGQRRNITPDQRRKISQEAAVGEAFGVFFDKEGREVIRYPRIGLQIEDLANIPNIITIVGGRAKAQAIAAFYKTVPHPGILFCDEALAKQVLNG